MAVWSGVNLFHYLSFWLRENFCLILYSKELTVKSETPVKMHV